MHAPAAQGMTSPAAYSTAEEGGGGGGGREGLPSSKARKGLIYFTAPLLEAEATSSGQTLCSLKAAPWDHKVHMLQGLVCSNEKEADLPGS